MQRKIFTGCLSLPYNLEQFQGIQHLQEKAEPAGGVSFGEGVYRGGKGYREKGPRLAARDPNFFSGVSDGIWTHDLLGHNQAL